MQHLKKAVAYLAWALAFGLSVALAWEFHGGQNKIAIGLALLALVISATGLLFARDAWIKRAPPEFLLGIVMWLAGAAYFTITEFGYWDSTAAEHQAKYQQIKTAKERQVGISDRNWDALTTGNIPMSPAQLQAQINAAQMNERWTTTKSCTSASTVPSKEFCKSYFELQGKLAAAQQRVGLEAQFTKEAEKSDTTLVHNLLAGAEVLARRLKIDERSAADIVIISAWLLLLIVRDGGMLVADPVGRRRKAVERQEDLSASLAGSNRVQAPRSPLPHPAAKISGVSLPATPATEVEAQTRDWGMIGEDMRKVMGDLKAVVGNLPTPSPLPDPDGGTPAPAPEPGPVKEATAPEAGNVLKFLSPKDMPTAEWKIEPAKQKASKKKADETSVNRWLRDFAQAIEIPEADGDEEPVWPAGTPFGNCWDSYEVYCQDRGEKKHHKRQFSSLLATALGLPGSKAKGAKRDGNGRVFPLVLVEKQAMKRRA